MRRIGVAVLAVKGVQDDYCRIGVAVLAVKGVQDDYCNYQLAMVFRNSTGTVPLLVLPYKEPAVAETNRTQTCCSSNSC